MLTPTSRRGSSTLALTLLHVAACSSSERGPTHGAPAPVVAAISAQAPPSVDLTACSVDDECTFVSLGCCSTTPVNRAHVDAAQRELDASGEPYCAVKTACGPGGDGTWAGTPGRCVAGRCGCDAAHPLAANCRGE